MAKPTNGDPREYRDYQWASSPTIIQFTMNISYQISTVNKRQAALWLSNKRFAIELAV